MLQATSEREKARDLMESLHAAARNDTLTIDCLSEAVRFVYDNGDDYEYSVGAAWICSNIEAFAECVGPQAEQFYCEHPEMAERAVRHPKLLALIAPEQRMNFIRNVVKTQRASGWVEAAFKNGIDKSEIADLLMEQILDDPKREAERFVIHGSGELPASWQPQVLPSDKPWAMFLPHDLRELLELCLPYRPAELIEQRSKLIVRFGRTVANDLCNKAANHLTSVHRFTLDQLRLFSLDIRIGIIGRLDLSRGVANIVTVQFICDTALDAAQDKPDPCLPLIDRIEWTPLAYAGVHSLKRDVPAHMKTHLLNRLTQKGFLIGAIEQGQFVPKGADRPVLQWQVRHGKKIYVQNRRQYDFHPQVGDQVIFEPAKAKHLTTRGETQIFAANHFYYTNRLT